MAKKELCSIKENSKTIKRDSRKIAYLLFLLLMTATLLSTSSYAWFTTNRVVSIDTLNVRVKTEGSLEISVDGINWKAGINQDEIIRASETYLSSINQLPSLISPVSTNGSLGSDGLINMYYGKVSSNSNGDYILVTTKSGEGADKLDEAKFIAFDVFLKINESKDLYLTGDSDIIYNGEVSVGAENAMRGAFLVSGNVSSGSSISQIQSLVTNDNNNVYLWEPNYDVHTKNGVSNARDLYGITTTLSNASIIAYDGVVSEFGVEDNILLGNAQAKFYPDKFERVVPDIVTSSANSSNQRLFTLKEGITKVRIYF